MNALDYIPSRVINRPVYLDKAIAFLNIDVIKVFTGQRRVGKSFMLFQVMNYLMEKASGLNMIFISKELPEFAFIKTDDDLLNFLKDKHANNANYLFIDEVQEIERFENALRSLLAQKKWDI